MTHDQNTIYIHHCEYGIVEELKGTQCFRENHKLVLDQVIGTTMISLSVDDWQFPGADNPINPFQSYTVAVMILEDQPDLKQGDRCQLTDLPIEFNLFGTRQEAIDFIDRIAAIALQSLDTWTTDLIVDLG